MSNRGFSTAHIWAIRFIVSFVAFVVFSISAIVIKCFLVICFSLLTNRVTLYKLIPHQSKKSQTFLYRNLHIVHRMFRYLLGHSLHRLVFLP